MVIEILCTTLFFIEIILLILAIRKNSQNKWGQLFANILSSILVGILYITYFINNAYPSILDVVPNIILGILVVFFNLLLLVISLVIKKEMKPIENETKDKKNIVKIIINVIIIFSILFMDMFIENLKYEEEKKQSIEEEKALKEETINNLIKKYGDGNYKVVKLSNGPLNDSSWWLGAVEGYKLEVNTSYMNTNFEVRVRYNTLEIYSENFLNVYYKEKKDIEYLDEYLKEYINKKYNDHIQKSFNANINFNNINIDNYTEKNYGKIPSINELSEYVKCVDPKFDIKDNIGTKEELLEYLKELTKFYIKDLNLQKISYSQEDKYFRYKYDYTKLGVNDYKDQYNGYGGYVLAGEYIYLDTEEKYVLKNEDKIVRINILGQVTTLNLEEVLK